MGSRAYRLTLEGELSDRAARAFEGMTLTREDGTTVLFGRVREPEEMSGSRMLGCEAGAAGPWRDTAIQAENRAHVAGSGPVAGLTLHRRHTTNGS